MGELLGAAAWAGKIYSGGWVDGSGHTFASVEPATGRQLDDVGSAAPDDVQQRGVAPSLDGRHPEARPHWAMSSSLGDRTAEE